MSDIDHMPRRLVDSTQDAFLQSVLRSAKSDEPSAGSRDALLAGLGLAGAIGTGAPLTVKWSGGAIAKWFVLASVGAVAIGSVLMKVGEPTSAKMQVFEHVAPIVRPSDWTSDRATTAVAPLAAEARMSDESAGLNVPRSAPAARIRPIAVPASPEVVAAEPAKVEPAEPTPAAVDAQHLAEELKMLERARVASKRGDQAAALAVLNKHAQDGTGVLKIEELVLRVQTLVRSGDRSGAQAALSGLEAAGASSAHLSRARAAIAAMPKD